MKKIISALLICILSASFLFWSAVGVAAEGTAALTLQYKHGEYLFEGLEIKIYRVASIESDGSFSLEGAFEELPVSLEGITSQTEWKSIASTLSAYCAADSIVPDGSVVTDSTGKASFNVTDGGLYLTLSQKAETESSVVTFESSVIAVPREAGEINAYPKCASYTPTQKPENVEYKAVKLWKDSSADTRPEYIEIDILKDGELYSTEKLSSENNWSTSWSAPDDGAVWQAVERNVPDGYTVTVSAEGTTLVITNTAIEDESPDAPQTGESGILWPYALAMCMAGILITAIAFWRMRSEG